MTINNPQWQDAVDAIQSAQTVLVVAHVSPDGDAIGSLLGLTESLRLMGKTVTGALDDGVPGYLAFIPNTETIVTEVSEGEFDLMISTDASDMERSGRVGEYGFAHSQTVINIDHHATNTGFGDIHLVVPSAVSATEVVFDLLMCMEHDISEDVAYALLSGLVTDTLGFRVNSTTSRTLEIAQVLMQKNASLSTIMQRTLNSRAYQEVELWKLVFSSVELDNGVISANVTLADIENAGLDNPTDGGLVSYLVNVNEAKVSVVFKEQLENKVEISFRAKFGYDVATLAFELGGGGHKQASGCTVDGSLEEVRKRVLPLAQNAIKQGVSELV
jgi:bifunctional oligoribonuclease and PAP phosphatase NrnA